MSIYTAQCKLFGTYSAQKYTSRQLIAQDATKLLQLRNHSANLCWTFHNHIMRVIKHAHLKNSSVFIMRPDDIQKYQCDNCNMQTCARQHSIISQYPKILCIVLPRKKSNETKIKLAVQYPLRGLFVSVHHMVNRGKSGHYIAICEHQDSNSWFLYDDDDARRVQFVNKKNGKVLTEFMKSAAILFDVNYTAVTVHSNNLPEHNENDETQSLVVLS